MATCHEPKARHLYIFESITAIDSFRWNERLRSTPFIWVCCPPIPALAQNIRFPRLHSMSANHGCSLPLYQPKNTFHLCLNVQVAMISEIGKHPQKHQSKDPKKAQRFQFCHHLLTLKSLQTSKTFFLHIKEDRMNYVQCCLPFKWSFCVWKDRVMKWRWTNKAFCPATSRIVLLIILHYALRWERHKEAQNPVRDREATRVIYNSCERGNIEYYRRFKHKTRRERDKGLTATEHTLLE